ncbi:STAS domain-containing protein [Blastococcus sp. TF02-09]|uniref:STAS domain-containing protein n=1 Tax=Blastococcus sp. TF02-09 TaxID=2250576 RepID=UPI001313ED64|nr:STAS domain-containing protein [Blastococcus sp. TF02-9]
MTDLVRIDVDTFDRTVHVTARGEIDSSSSPVFERSLDDVLEGRVGELVIDLCGVTFLDSAGLCVLASAHRRARERQIPVRLLASTRAVVRPLEITGLWRLLGAEQVQEARGDQSVA